MNYIGLLVGLGAFLCIGLFHPLVIKAEYHWGVRCWWAFALLGLVACGASLFVESYIWATLLGVFGFSAFWSIHEIFKQRERVAKGWFPANPKRKQTAHAGQAATTATAGQKILVALLFLCGASAAAYAEPTSAQMDEPTSTQMEEPTQKRASLYRGFDGGMMLHTGYLNGTIAPLGNYRAQGAPMGIGGVARIHLGEHLRVGGEGYISTLSQLDNGSYIECGWGGVLADFYWIFGRFQPYAGLTIGGGALTHNLMFESPTMDWKPVGNTVFQKQGFMAIDPFVGCDYILTKALHLTLKLDYLCAIGQAAPTMPTGPRIYFGILFYR